MLMVGFSIKKVKNSSYFFCSLNLEKTEKHQENEVNDEDFN
jgi:hypothetical protein